MADSYTTVTDKTNFRVSLYDRGRYNSLQPKSKKLFKKLRDSMLEIFPYDEETEKYDEIAIKYAENFAFIAMDAIKNSSSDLSDQVTALEKRIKKLENKATTV